MLTPVKWAGISQLNNFQYESGSIKVWRAFRVGVGSRKKALPMKSTRQVTGIKVLKPFRAPGRAKGALKKPASWSRNQLSARYAGKRITAKKLKAPCIHVLTRGVLKSTAPTAPLSAILTSASTSTNFTGRRRTITSDGSGGEILLSERKNTRDPQDL